MSDLHCVVCDRTGEPLARVGVLAICRHCGASNVIDADGTVRRATANDTDILSPGDRALLTKARSSVARPRTK